MSNWWKHGIIYQIYPLSFQDSNGDGKGDLRGILQRLPYLEWLGVDALWISPLYPSPMKDCGYDISNYCDVSRDFGSLADFDALVTEAHRLEIRIILDFVPNHTSDQHPWFLESRSSVGNPKRDWYLWRDPKNDGSPPNNWMSQFGGSAWEFDERTGQSYYHAFLKEQPDLNWRNPEVRQAMLDVLKFWMDRGVDGFRIDALWYLLKDAQLRDNPLNPDYKPGSPSHKRVLEIYSGDQPEIFEVIAEMRRTAERYPERVLIGEIYLPLEKLVSYYGVNGTGLHLPFNFHLILAPWKANEITHIISEYERLIPPGEWPNWVIGNHDQKRIASRVGQAQARVAAMLLLTLRGTPTLYYGDELGMEDVPVPLERIRDTWTRNEPGIGVGRDPGRTPMQWNNSPQAGFSEGEPWLPMSAAFEQVNVETLSRDPSSILSLYRSLIQLRRRRRELTAGAKRLIPCPEGMIAYERSSPSGKLLVALNLTSEPRELDGFSGRILLSTHLDRRDERTTGRLSLRPDEGVVVETRQ